MGSRRSSLLALAAYLALSFLYFGVPIVSHPGRDYIGEGFDPQIFIWSLAWWPHAIGNLDNPILSDVVWAPTGVNLAWVTSVPGLALALAPVTLFAGPVVSYNVAALLLPALAAWTAFLLCRHLTGRFWPSLAGGYLFGFSSYMLGQTEGHLHMSSVFLVPLAALLVVRFFEGSLSRRALALLLGLLLAVQISFSTELALTLSLALVVGLVTGFALVPSLRARMRRIVAPLAGAYALAVVLTSPLLVSALADFEDESFNEPELYSGDLLNVVVPTRLAALAGDWSRYFSDHFAANDAENGLYLGLPMLAIVVWYGWNNRRNPLARLLVALIALGLVVALGTALRVRGAQYAPLPWKFLDELPLLNNVLPVRFSLYVALGAAVVAALWAASTATAAWVRIALTAAAVAVLAPHLWLGVWHVEPTRPSFFASGHDRDCLGPDENVLMLPHPAWSDSTLWQAEADFRFRMADGALNPLPPEELRADRALLDALSENILPPGGAAALVDFARRQGATAIVLDGRKSRPWRTALSEAGFEPEWIGGVYLYRLDGRSPSGCR